MTRMFGEELAALTAEEVRALRRMKGLKGLAKQTGVSPGALYALRRGKRSRASWVGKVRDALGPSMAVVPVKKGKVVVATNGHLVAMSAEERLRRLEGYVEGGMVMLMGLARLLNGTGEA